MNIRGVLSLISIQSTPVTVVSLGLGYATIRGTVLDEHIVPLLVAGALGHWAFYSMNDLFDAKWDERQERLKKPIVRGDITRVEGTMLCIVLLLVMAEVVVEYMRPTIWGWLLAILFGFIYNWRSKTDVLAGVYLELWGFSIIFIGAIHAGGVNGATVIIALLLGVHMFWMTMMGNLKDIGQGENSIAELLDCKIVSKNGYSILWTSARFNLVSISTILLHIILLLLIPIGDGVQTSDTPFIYIAVMGGVAIWWSFNEVMYQPGFDRDVMKRDIVKFEITSVSFVILVSISFMSAMTALVMVAATLIWGLVWQTVLYGHPLRFP